MTVRTKTKLTSNWTFSAKKNVPTAKTNRPSEASNIDLRIENPGSANYKVRKYTVRNI